MKKIIGIVSIALLPAISFAQGMVKNYVDRGYGYGILDANHSALVIFFVLLIPLIWVIFAISIFVFWVVMLIDAIKNSPENTKIVWVLVIIFTHIIGALIYYFVEKRPKNKIEKEKTKE